MNLGFWNVDQLCARVNLEVSTPVIDLSKVTFFEPFALVYLGMFLRYFNAQGKRFALQPPSSEDARNYLARQNFWERFNFDDATINVERLGRFTSTTSLNDIVDVEKDDYVAEEVAEKVVRVLRASSCTLPPNRIAEIVSELVDNFAQHSGKTLAVLALQYYPNGRRLVIAIGDYGVGIRASLALNPKHAWLATRPHYEAALKAFEPLVSRRAEGGTGFTEVRDGVLDLKGWLHLATGDGYVRVKNGRTTVGEMAFNLPGVQIQLSFPERR